MQVRNVYHRTKLLTKRRHCGLLSEWSIGYSVHTEASSIIQMHLSWQHDDVWLIQKALTVVILDK